MVLHRGPRPTVCSLDVTWYQHFQWRFAYCSSLFTCFQMLITPSRRWECILCRGFRLHTFWKDFTCIFDTNFCVNYCFWHGFPVFLTLNWLKCTGKLKFVETRGTRSCIRVHGSDALEISAFLELFFAHLSAWNQPKTLQIWIRKGNFSLTNWLPEWTLLNQVNQF